VAKRGEGIWPRKMGFKGDLNGIWFVELVVGSVLGLW
jgi:hypothetical protein